MDDLECELRQTLQRRPAPPGLKRRLLERRQQEHAQRLRRRVVLWERLAASVLLAVALAGAVVWHNAEQRRKGEEAREQVLTALRITSRALQQMNAQLAARNHDGQD